MLRSVLLNYLAPQSGNANTLYCVTLCFCNSRPCVVFLVTVPLPFAVDTDLIPGTCGQGRQVRQCLTNRITVKRLTILLFIKNDKVL